MQSKRALAVLTQIRIWNPPENQLTESRQYTAAPQIARSCRSEQLAGPTAAAMRQAIHTGYQSALGIMTGKPHGSQSYAEGIGILPSFFSGGAADPVVGLQIMHARGQH